MRPRAVTFDAFGTLVEHGLETIEDCAAAVSAEHGIPDGRLLEAWQRRYFALLGGPRFYTVEEANERSLQEATASFGVRTDLRPHLDAMVERWAGIRPYPETLRVLETLGDVPVAIVSNADHALLLRVLRAGGIGIPLVFSSERSRSYKPDARIFQEALGSLGLPAESVLHVGDSLEADVAGAAALGMRTAWVRRRGGAPPPGVRPDHVLPTLDGVLDLL